MKLFSFTYILLLIANLSAYSLDNSSISITGYTISDVCHGFICHGPIVVNYSITDSKDNMLENSVSKHIKDGQFRFDNLKPGHCYKFKIIDTNFLYYEYLVEVPDSFIYKQLSKDFLVYPKADHVEILFHVSPFEYHKSRIRIGIDYYLDNFVNLIKFNPSVNFEIVSYPDDETDASKNGELTFNRCLNIRNYFIDKGVDESRITYLPNIKTDPKNPPYDFKTAKGKNYVGSTYLIVKLSEQ